MENQYIKQFPDLMQGKKIMYVHGFLSSGQSGTVKMLQELMPNATLVAEDIPVHAEEAIEMLRDMQEGRCFPGGILKVDSFVNHQMDPILMMDLAKEFVRLFQDIKYNKIITIEASGIAPAIMVGYLTHLPVVFVKKKQPKTMEGMITSVVHSFTKDRDYTVCVSDSYLTPDDHVIFIDDFLANGNASKGVMELCEKAGAKIEAMGFIIEKAFQHGGDFLRREGMRYEALATVESLEDCKIVLK